MERTVYGDSADGVDRQIKKRKISYGKYYICTMIKDEHPYIREWAIYHLKLGFDKIHLYDDGSSRPYDNELGDLICDGFVEMRSYKGERFGRQTRMFDEFAHSREWGESDYCAFIDVDEFIFLDGGKNIDQFMALYREFAAAQINTIKLELVNKCLCDYY